MRTRRCTRPSRQAGPSSSGVTANGANAVAGFDCTKPKPLASSRGTRLRRVTSLSRQTRRTPARGRGGVDAPGHVAQDDGDLRLEVQAQRRIGEGQGIGRAEQHARAALVDQRVGQQLGRRSRRRATAGQPHVVQEGRAVQPLVGAGQGRAPGRRGSTAVPGSSPRPERAASSARAGCASVPAVQGRLQGGNAGGAGAQRVPSARTTTRVPSRPPSRIVASLMP